MGNKIEFYKALAATGLLDKERPPKTGAGHKRRGVNKAEEKRRRKQHKKQLMRGK